MVVKPLQVIALKWRYCISAGYAFNSGGLGMHTGHDKVVLWVEVALLSALI
jgi:hypothetical protein